MLTTVLFCLTNREIRVKPNLNKKITCVNAANCGFSKFRHNNGIWKTNSAKFKKYLATFLFWVLTFRQHTNDTCCTNLANIYFLAVYEKLCYK